MIACAWCFSSSPACSSSSLLCLGAATVWATIDAYRSVDRATAASAERVSQALEALYWRELLLRGSRTREHLLPVPEWRTIETMKLISPGVCVRFEPAGRVREATVRPEQGHRQRRRRTGSPRPCRRCSAATPRSTEPISARATTAGTVSAVADPDAAIRLAWRHILDNIGVALLMAARDRAARLARDCAYAGAGAARSWPRCKRMAHGQYRTSLPRFRSMELAMIGQAVGDLGDRLAQATEERAALTRRLLEIRDDERRTLARELHDEFGQNLTAILAFASTIEATPRQPKRQGRMSRRMRG